MKHLLYTLAFFLYLGTSAQTYPFSEGFQGTTSGQIPVGWSGDIDVLSYHGQNEEKGLAAEIGGGDLTDSIISPLIGPLTSSSAVTFYYRIIDKNIYPSTPTNLEGNDKVELMLSADGTSYQTVLLIDENNHNTSFNFVRKKIFLSQFAGTAVNLKFVCSFGAGASYFVDIDSVRVYDDPNSGINDLSTDAKISLFPNPCNQSAACNVSLSNNEAYTLTVFDILGNKVYNIKSAGTTSLPTANFTGGLYIVQVKQNGKTSTQKLVIQ